MKAALADIKKKIKSFTDTNDNLQKQINYLEIDLKRARSDLSNAKVKDNKLSTNQKKYKDKLN